MEQSATTEISYYLSSYLFAWESYGRKLITIISRWIRCENHFLNDFYYYYYLFIVIFYIAHAFHLLLKKVTTYKEEKTEYFYALKNEFYKWRCKIRL